jgi:acetoacetate decarboxylase
MSIGRLFRMVRPGPIYRDAHYLAVEIDVDPARARRWLPRSLSLAKPARATVFTAWFPHTSFGSVYREAGIFLHVTHWGFPAVFSPWMIVDDDVALIGGRELLGYPKKLGEIGFTLDGTRIEAVAHRRGAELVRMTGTIGAVATGAPPMLGRPHRNVRGAGGLWSEIVAFTPREEIVSVRHAALEVTVGGSERDPLHELGFGTVRAAYLYRVNLGAAVPFPVGLVSPIFGLRNLLARVH